MQSLDFQIGNRKFDVPLEALRGIAALLVVLLHSLKNGPTPDPVYRLSGIWQYPAPGHLSVIIFFMLSGYVIGLSNPKPIATGSERKLYLKKRFVRLYPLYIIIIVVLIVMGISYGNPYSLGAIVGYLLFLQNLVLKVPNYNPPIWSLSYEVVYYLLFLAVSFYQWRAEAISAFFLVLGLILTKLSVQPIVLASYSYGAVFWFLGLALVKIKRSEKPAQYGTMLAFLLLLLCYERMNLIFSVMYALHLDVQETQVPAFLDRAVIFSDLSYVLYCVPLLACFTNRIMWKNAWLQIIPFAIPIFYIIAYVVSGKIYKKDLFDSLFLCMIFYFIAIAFYLLRHKINTLAKFMINRFASLGLISYGVYIIHYPLYFLFHHITYFSGTVYSFLTRLVIHFIFVLVVSWLLERRIQLWFKKKLMPSRVS